MNHEIVLLSGPNLDLLGERSPEIYGPTTLAEHVARFTELASGAGYSVRHLQSNFEGELIEAVHQARGRAAAIVINAGALTHSSWALADALSTFEGVKIEVHLTNPAAREPVHRDVWSRRRSASSHVCRSTFANRRRWRRSVPSRRHPRRLGPQRHRRTWPRMARRART